MRTAYRTLAYSVAALVAVQAAAVALGFFAIIHLVEDGGAFTTAYNYGSNAGLMLHRYVGMGLIPLLAIALVVIGALSGIRGAARRAWGVLGLVVLQIALVFLAFMVSWGGSLHGLNALAIFVAAVWAARLESQGAPDDARASASIAA